MTGTQSSFATESYQELDKSLLANSKLPAVFPIGIAGLLNT